MDKKTLTKVIGIIISFFAVTRMIEIIASAIEYDLSLIDIIDSIIDSGLLYIVLLYPVLIAVGILMLVIKKPMKIFPILALVFVSVVYILKIVQYAEHFEYYSISNKIDIIIGNINVLEIGLLIINLVLKDKSNDIKSENKVNDKNQVINQEAVSYLKQYKELYDSGAISEEEYNKLKGEILK